MQRKIVIIEDDPATGRLLQVLFKNHDFDVLLYNKVDDIHIVEIYANKPDAIVLDLMLPLLSGEVILAQCRQFERDCKIKRVPIVVISAKTLDKVKIECLAIGADDFIEKPFSPREVVARVLRFLK